MLTDYIICATPRSGSNYLCELLSSLRFAGRPEEHLWDPPDGTPLEPLAHRWPKVLEAGTGPNGVFGLKLMWYQAERLERELPAVLGMPNRPLAEALGQMLCGPRYIYLTRRDRLRQSISFARALQTKRWRSIDAVGGEEAYDRAAIDDALEFFARDERNWETFFARQRIDPYRLTYEEIEAHPEDAVAGIAQHLGYDGPPIVLGSTRHQRQADALTEEWVGRYHASLG